MAVADDSIAVDHELRRPKIAKVVAKNLLFVIDDYGKLDAHLLDSNSEFRHISFVFGARRVDTNDNQPLRRILVGEFPDVRHGLDAGLAVECPEIDDYNAASQRFQCERSTIYPCVGF